MPDHKKNEQSFFKSTLQYVKPFVPLLPRVKNLSRNLMLREKFLWTAVAILVYLLASQVPLVGIINSTSKDPFSWMGIMLASNRGTLMDLGISPVDTSSMIINFLSSVGLIQPDYSISEDKELVDALQKLIALLLTAGQAVVKISTGYYGPPQSLGLSCCSLLFVQLVFSGLIIILLDDLLQKGYGLGNGINLFIVTKVCERIVWCGFSPRVYFTGRGMEFEGCIVAAFHLLFTRKNKLAAIYEIFFRQNLPNLFSLLLTFAVFALVVYLQSLRVELPLVSTMHRGLSQMFPIKLLYTSIMPVMIQSYAVTYLVAISKFLYKFYPKNIFVRLLGVWDYGSAADYQPVSGLSYYIMAPASISEVFSRPFFSILYIIVSLYIGGILSRNWIDSHDENSESVARKIKKMNMQLRGTTDASMVSKLNDYIPVAAFLGGVISSFIIVVCDILSTVGSGSNIFLTASIINQYIELMVKEAGKRSGKAYID